MKNDSHAPQMGTAGNELSRLTSGNISRSLVGLIVGLLLYGIYAFTVATHTLNYPVAERSLLLNLLGLLIPISFTVFGSRLSKWASINVKDNNITINSLTFIVVVLLPIDFLIVYVTLMAGHC